MNTPSAPQQPPDDEMSTVEVARRLGLAVRSVQLMADRGELDAWKTPGGHRRISRSSVQRWLQRNRPEDGQPAAADEPAAAPRPSATRPATVLLIEDSAHFQNLVKLLVRQHFPDVELHVADDGVTGLAWFGRLDPDVLIVDILLPGIDGATLVTSLRSHPQFSRCQLVVVTSLDEAQRAPFSYALEGLPVIHKSRIVGELPPLLSQCLARLHAGAANA